MKPKNPVFDPTASNDVVYDRRRNVSNVACSRCGGVCYSVPASRLSEAMGVETWQCSGTCKQKYAHDFRAEA